MTAACRNSRRIAGILAACALVLTVFSGQQAHAKDKSLKGALEHALVGQVVASKILLGDRARPSDVAREGITLDFPVHTLVNADTGEVSYRVEDALWLEWAEVYPGDMVRSFGAGTSFRINAIHSKDDIIEIKLKHLGGGSAEVKLMLGKGWQSKYDAASVQARLARVFAFEGPGQQEVEAEQAPRQAEPVETATPTITPAVPAAPAEAPANQAPVPPNSTVNLEHPELASDFPIRPAYISCKTKPSSPPFQCGEKVMAIGESPGWVKVRTGENWEGYVASDSLVYGEPPAPAEQPAGPDEDAQQSPPPQTTEQTPSTYAPPAEPASRAGDSWSWYQYVPAGLLLLAAVALLIGLAKASKKRQQAEETRNKESAEKCEKEERRRRNQEEHERATAKRKYSELVSQFTDLVATAGSQAVDAWRGGMAIEGGFSEGTTATKFVGADVIRIISTVSKVKEEVPIGLGRLLQAIFGSLNLWMDISLEHCNTKIEETRQKTLAASLPDMVTLLAMYDKMQGTRLAAKAAKAYWALVLVACEVVDNKLGVATKLVQAKYLDFLRPYLSGTGNNGNGEQQSWSNGTPETDSSSFRGCGECPKYYQVLRVSPNSSKEEVKTAFRSLAKIYHSDKHHGQEDGVRRTADDLFRNLKEAYDHISSHWNP